MFIFYAEPDILVQILILYLKMSVFIVEEMLKRHARDCQSHFLQILLVFSPLIQKLAGFSFANECVITLELISGVAEIMGIWDHSLSKI